MLITYFYLHHSKMIFFCVCVSDQDYNSAVSVHASLDSNELDMILLGKISAGIHVSAKTVTPKQVPKERENSRTDLFHHGHKVCIYTFVHIHAISRDRFNALKKHYQDNGIVARDHGLTKRLPRNANID